MPLLSITTNIELNDTTQLMKILTVSIAKLLGKPESYVMLNLQSNKHMSYANTSEPLAYCELKSLGLSAIRTQEFSKAICDLLEQNLDIPSERVYIEFSSPERHMFGWKGSTF